ncbi:MAG: Ig-like domain-containing protein [Candidatus Hydrogenedentes bacterium]|nr:Ig-like domain-containing protein [Candidatus Hydrogenedentota bacterium]
MLCVVVLAGAMMLSADAQVQVEADSIFVTVGGTQQLRVLDGAVGSQVDVSGDPSIYYEPSDTDVITVNATGLVSGAGKGTASVHVIFGNLINGADTLQSGIIDLIVGTEDDRDGDTLPNEFETEAGLNPGDPLDAETDFDGDGLNNKDEFERGTDPAERDTDLDGATDGEEVANGTDPLVRDAFRFDETWLFEINGQTVQAGPGGAFRISNITAPDDFGEEGQGSPRDGLSDAFLRVTGTSVAGGQTRYAYSNPFQIDQNQGLVIPNLMMSDTPPPVPSRITLQAPVSLIMSGATLQLGLTATLPDGSTTDASSRAQFSTYISSNPAIASVNLNGLVTGNGSGTAFITATNEGATAVAQIQVSAVVSTITVQGYVQLPDGSPVANAVVTTFFGESTTTDANGFFSFEVNVPAGVSTVAIRVRFEMGELVFSGGTSVDTSEEGSSDAGIILLEPGDSSGREFVVVFETNFDNLGLIPTLFISGESATFGDIQIPGISFVQQFQVTPGVVTEVQLPGAAVLNVNNGIEERGILISSFDDITVYGLSRKANTTDAFAGFPVDTFGTSHRVLAFPTASNGQSQFAVVAPQDDTTVTITPSVEASGRPAGTPFEVVLNNLEAFQLKTFTQGTDLSGTLITSDKPVGLFSGNSCANVPNGSVGFCDHLTQQIPPLNTWGTQVITLQIQTRSNGDTFLVLAAEDETTVTIDGPVPGLVTLDAGQTNQLLLEGANIISADKPILVAQYANGSQFDGALGDPFMMLVPPSEQFLNRYTFATPGSGFTRNFVNIIARTADADAGAVLLDGAPLEATVFTPVGESGFSSTSVEISIGSHSIASTQPLGIYVYGFGVDDSYGYPGGLSLSNLKLLPGGK